jgi:hypothetical protein
LEDALRVHGRPEIFNSPRQHPTRVPEQAETLFANKRGPRKEDGPGDAERLYSQIGRLKVELDWLKKKSGLSL